MIPRFDRQDGFDSTVLGTLTCPSCRSDYLSHDIVDVFERTGETETGVHLKVGGGNAIVSNTMDGNPSERSNGIAIRFRCENCDDKKFVLTIAQHKGRTFVDFAREPKSPKPSAG